MKKNLPLILIIASFILIIINLLTFDSFDNGFFLRVLSSVLVIVAMFLVIEKKKNNEQTILF